MLTGDSVRVPNVSAHLLWRADYIVRVHWRGLRWLTAEGMRFDMMGFLRGLDCGKNGETTVMIGNQVIKAGAPFPARLIAVSLPPEKH